MGIKKDELAGVVAPPLQADSVATNISAVGVTVIGTAPPAGVVRFIGSGEGGPSFHLENKDGSSMDYNVQINSLIVASDTLATGDSNDLEPLYPLFSTDTNFEFEAVSAVSAVNVDVTAGWLDLTLKSNEGTSVVVGNGTTPVMLIGGPAVGFTRTALWLVFPREGSVAPGVHWHNKDTVNHGWAFSINNGAIIIKDDASAFRAFGEFGQELNSWFLQNGESLWVTQTEATTTTESEFRVIYQDLPIAP